MKPWPLVIAWAVLCLGTIALIGYTEQRVTKLIQEVTTEKGSG